MSAGKLNKNVRALFILSESDHNKLKAIAKGNKVSMSNVIRQLISKEWDESSHFYKDST